MAERRRGPAAMLSIRTTAVLAVLLVVVTPIVAVAVVALLSSRAESRLREEVVQAADEIAERVAAGGSDAEIRLIATRRAVRAVVLAPGREVHADIDAIFRDAPTLAGSTMGAELRHQFDREIQPSPVDERPVVATAQRAGRGLRCGAAPDGAAFQCEAAVLVADARGERVVYAQKAAARSLERLAELRRPLLWLLAITAATGLLLAAWLARRIVGPLTRLRAEVVARAESPRTATDPVALAAPPEIADVVGSFNSLLRTLGEQRSATEGFVADLAHELKSPLATLRTTFESLSPELDAAAMDATLATVQRELRRIDGTVGELLELARAEAGLPAEPRERFALAELARGVTDAWSSERRPAHIEVTLSVPDAGPAVRATPGALGRALRNLLDNAGAFARSEIRVSVRADGHQAILEVSDDGPGFPPETLGRVFDRFVTRRPDGTGLGLALVRAVAESNGGRAEADSAEGARVTLILPRG